MIMTVKKNGDGQTLVQFTKGTYTVSLLSRQENAEWVELACFTEGVPGMTRGPDVVSVEEAIKVAVELHC